MPLNACHPSYCSTNCLCCRYFCFPFVVACLSHCSPLLCRCCCCRRRRVARHRCPLLLPLRRVAETATAKRRNRCIQTGNRGGGVGQAEISVQRGGNSGGKRMKCVCITARSSATCSRKWAVRGGSGDANLQSAASRGRKQNNKKKSAGGTGAQTAPMMIQAHGTVARNAVWCYLSVRTFLCRRFGQRLC